MVHLELKGWTLAYPCIQVVVNVEQYKLLYVTLLRSQAVTLWNSSSPRAALEPRTQ